VAGSADRRGASASRGGEGEAGRWCGRASRGQPEPRPALGSAGGGSGGPVAAAATGAPTADDDDAAR